MILLLVLWLGIPVFGMGCVALGDLLELRRWQREDGFAACDVCGEGHWGRLLGAVGQRRVCGPCRGAIEAEVAKVLLPPPDPFC